MVVIVDRGLGEEVAKVLRENGVTFNLISPAYVAAGSKIMDYLGLTSLERDIILSIVSEQISHEVLSKILYKFDLDEPGSGIAFTIPVSGVSGPLALRYMLGDQIEKGCQNADSI